MDLLERIRNFLNPPQQESEIAARPGHWSDRSMHYLEHLPAPVNMRPGPLVKTLETIPSGEQRPIFSVGPGVTEIFRNSKAITVEINEIFMVATAPCTVQIFTGLTPQTAPIPLAAGQEYSDAGFILGEGDGVQLNVTGGSLIGHLRWRYNQ